MAGPRVADVLADGLARAGVARLFVAPGAPAALVAAARRRGVDVLEAPDALAAGVLAAVTGEVGGLPGAMLAGLGDTAGLVRGLAHAHRDRAPLVALTDAGPDVGLLAPAVKGSVVVEPGSAGHWIAHAAQLAMRDPRGPAHLVVGAGIADAPALPVAAACRPAPLPPPEPDALAALAAALATATRPLLVTGLECGPDDARWLRSFAETLPAPVLATAKGKGALADPHPLALGRLVADHAALARADLVILVGVDAAELPPGVLPVGGRLARIGRSPWPGGQLAAGACGDLALVIEELAPTVRGRPAADWDVAELDRIKRALGRSATPAARLVALVREATPAGTLAAGDAAALAGWQAVAPRETLTALGPAPPGYAVLAALAAQVTCTDRRAVAFTRARALAAGGEAALELAVALGTPIVVVALDALTSGTTDRLRGAGVATFTSRGEADFAVTFSHAFLAARPALVTTAPDSTRPA
jgi:acetolactate synthase-1/2/3 large subunit